MDIEILSAQYTSSENKQVLAFINYGEYRNIPYYVSLVQDDNSPVYKHIREKIDSGEIAPVPFEEDINELAADVRTKRDSLLARTDKYMTSDYPISDETRDRLRKYRQALRDIPEQEGFPKNVVFPESPI